MARYKNIGASNYRRHNGELVPSGGEFEPTAKELSFMQNDPAVGIRLVEVTVEQVAAVHEEPETETPPAKVWTLKVSPEKYLARHPDGPQAALARELVGAK